VIEFNGVSFWFSEEETLIEKKDEVLHNVELVIPKGEFVVLLGRNGSGKSTLAKHCNGLLLPKKGTVIVDGKNTNQSEYLWDIRQKVGLVFQNPDNQIIATTVEEDVAFGPENLGVPQDEIRKRIDQALNIVGMNDFRKKEPHLLSGGQKQRVAIAGVLAMQPEYLVLDEATSMLDPEGRSEIMSLISQLRGSITIFHITHYIEEAVDADWVIIMDQGQVVAQGKPVDIFNRRGQIYEWGLELPLVSETAWILQRRFPELFPSLPLKAEELVAALCSFV
jgi:energy-coupling factor transport system ATP-binding protein